MSSLLPVGAGFVIGFLIGLTGMGGGALMTPFLLIVMKLDPVAAVGTDLVFAALTKIAGSAQHYRHGNVSFKQVLWMACGSLPASYMGAQIILHLNPQITQKIMPPVLGGILVLVGLIMMARALNVLRPRSIGEGLWPNPVALVGVGAAGGLLVGMSSIGGGTVIMAMMIVFFTIPLNYLIGLDVVHGALLATVAALTYALAGRTNWPLVSWLLIGSIPGVWLGVLSIKRIDKRIVRGVLSLLVIGAGINLLIGQ